MLSVDRNDLFLVLKFELFSNPLGGYAECMPTHSPIKINTCPIY